MELYTADYIAWLRKVDPESDYTIGVMKDYEVQESIKRFNVLVSKVRSEHTVIARGEDNYQEHRDNSSWSDFSRLIRGI